ncbi:MAG: hypothetical protein ACSHWY_09440 [Octadecabacter sp.]
MFTLLADALFTATRTNTNKDARNSPQPHADHYTPKSRRNPDWQARTFNPYRDLW